VGHRQEDSFGVPGCSEALRGEEPVAGAVSAACSVHVTWPVADVEVETGVEQRACEKARISFGPKAHFHQNVS
jgi:hypothetical protein